MNRALIVIPARWSSSRFPGKPLVSITGIPMLQRVWNIAKSVGQIEKVVIATDSSEIANFCLQIGAEFVITSASCLTGSDRVLEAVKILNANQDIIFSFQGDAVLLPPWIVEGLIDHMSEDKKIQIATPAIKLEGESLKNFIDAKNRGSSSGTCVTFDSKGDALYFSKSLIPYSRKQEHEVYRHLGLYAYRKEALESFAALKQGHFEKIEQLEQLRILESGGKIRVVVSELRGRTLHSVDNPEDVAIVEAIIEREGELCR